MKNRDCSLKVILQLPKVFIGSGCADGRSGDLPVRSCPRHLYKANPPVLEPQVWFYGPGLGIHTPPYNKMLSYCQQGGTKSVELKSSSMYHVVTVPTDGLTQRIPPVNQTMSRILTAHNLKFFRNPKGYANSSGRHQNIPERKNKYTYALPKYSRKIRYTYVPPKYPRKKKYTYALPKHPRKKKIYICSSKPSQEK